MQYLLSIQILVLFLINLRREPWTTLWVFWAPLIALILYLWLEPRTHEASSTLYRIWLGAIALIIISPFLYMIAHHYNRNNAFVRYRSHYFYKKKPRHLQLCGYKSQQFKIKSVHLIWSEYLNVHQWNIIPVTITLTNKAEEKLPVTIYFKKIYKLLTLPEYKDQIEREQDYFNSTASKKSIEDSPLMKRISQIFPPKTPITVYTHKRQGNYYADLWVLDEVFKNSNENKAVKRVPTKRSHMVLWGSVIALGRWFISHAMALFS